MRCNNQSTFLLAIDTEHKKLYSTNLQDFKNQVKSSPSKLKNQRDLYRTEPRTIPRIEPLSPSTFSQPEDPLYRKLWSTQSTIIYGSKIRIPHFLFYSIQWTPHPSHLQSSTYRIWHASQPTKRAPRTLRFPTSDRSLYLCCRPRCRCHI